MKKVAKFIVITSFCVTSFACAQGDQYSQYPQSSQYGQYSGDMNNSDYSSQGGYSQSYRQAYGQQGPGQYQNQGGSYGAGNQGYTQGNQGNQGSWSNWFGNDKNQTQNVPDSVISSRVMQNLKSTPYLSDGAQNIQVQTKDGKVTLKGKVANSNEKSMIEYMVKNVAGVKSVSNDLETAQ